MHFAYLYGILTEAKIARLSPGDFCLSQYAIQVNEAHP